MNSGFLKGQGALILSLLCLCAAAAHAQGPVIGGRVAFSPALTISPRMERLVSLETMTRFSPSLSVRSDIAELGVRVTVEHASSASVASGTTSLNLDRLELALFPTPWLSLHLGRFPYRPGRALSVSPNNYFSTVSISSLARTAVESLGDPNSLLQARVLAQRFYLIATAAPVPNVPQLARPGSIWVPDVGFPPVIDDPALSPEPLEFNERFAEPTARIDTALERVSAGIEVGTTIGPLDLALLYYRGIKPLAIPRARIDFPSVPLDSYDIYFAPSESVVDSLGIVGETVFSSASVWVDIAFLPRLPISTTEVDTLSKRTKLITPPAFEGVLGFSYRFSRPSIEVAAEYRRFEPVGMSDTETGLELISPPFDNDLLLTAPIRMGPEREWTVAPGAILSLDDSSAAIALSLEYRPRAAIRVFAEMPLFVGQTGSEYGQFQDILTARAGVYYNF